MSGDGKPYFVLTLPLRPEPWQQQELEQRFAVGCEIYNALLKRALTRYRQMAQTKAFRELQEQLFKETDKGMRKSLLSARDALVKQYRLRKYDICADATRYRQHFASHIDSPVVQNLALEVWQAVDGLVKGRSLEVYPKKEGQLKSLSGKTNQSSIRFRRTGETARVEWKGLILPLAREYFTAYEQKALEEEIRYCRIKRCLIRGKTRYFVELVLQRKDNAEASGNKQDEHSDLDSGQVLLRLSRNLVTVVTDSGRETFLLPYRSDILEQRKRELNRYLSHSRRSTNPQNYTPGGRIRKGDVTWNYSNHYRSAQSEFQELCRRQRVLKRQAAYRLAKRLLSYGDSFSIEDGGAEAPYEFLQILKYKLQWEGKTFGIISVQAKGAFSE